MYKSNMIKPNKEEGEMIFCMITPEMCERQLRNNKINRTLSPVRVNKYAKELENNYWVVNGETIKVSNTGVLLDGQTRMTACVKTGIPFYSYVFVDAPESIMGTIDTGKSKNNANFLQMRKYTYPRAFGTAINIANCLAKKEMYSKQSIDIRTLCDSSDREENIWELGFLERIGYSMLHESVVKCHSIKSMFDMNKDNIISPAKLSVIHHDISGRYGDKIANAFIKKIYSDLNYVGGDPVNALVRALKNNKQDKLGRKMSTNGSDYRLAVKAWNSFVSGINVKTTLSIRGIGKFTTIGDVSKNVNIFIDDDGILQRDIM